MPDNPPVQMSVSEEMVERGCHAACVHEHGDNLTEGSSLLTVNAKRAWEPFVRAILTAALSDQAVPRNGKPAFWTHDAEAAKSVGHLYYFAPTDRAKPPYRKQRHVTAIIDIADDGTLAGVELIDDMPPPPASPGKGVE